MSNEIFNERSPQLDAMVRVTLKTGLDNVGQQRAIDVHNRTIASTGVQRPFRRYDYMLFRATEIEEIRMQNGLTLGELSKQSKRHVIGFAPQLETIPEQQALRSTNSKNGPLGYASNLGRQRLPSNEQHAYLRQTPMQGTLRRQPPTVAYLDEANRVAPPAAVVGSPTNWHQQQYVASRRRMPVCGANVQKYAYNQHGTKNLDYVRASRNFEKMRWTELSAEEMMHIQNESKQMNVSNAGYDKSKSFYDSISCHAGFNHGYKSNWRQPSNINKETFGVGSLPAAATNRNTYRGRYNFHSQRNFVRGATAPPFNYNFYMGNRSE